MTSRIRLFVPCLDKGTCFLCCLNGSWGAIVSEQQGFINGNGIIRVPSLSGGGGRSGENRE